MVGPSASFAPLRLLFASSDEVWRNAFPPRGKSRVARLESLFRLIRDGLEEIIGGFPGLHEKALPGA